MLTPFMQVLQPQFCLLDCRRPQMQPCRQPAGQCLPNQNVVAHAQHQLPTAHSGNLLPATYRTSPRSCRHPFSGPARPPSSRSAQQTPQLQLRRPSRGAAIRQ